MSRAQKEEEEEEEERTKLHQWNFPKSPPFDLGLGGWGVHRSNLRPAEEHSRNNDRKHTDELSKSSKLRRNPSFHKDACS